MCSEIPGRLKKSLRVVCIFLKKKKKKKTTVCNKKKANNSKRKKFLHSTVTTLIYRITIQDHKLLIALHSIHQVHVVTF